MSEIDLIASQLSLACAKVLMSLALRCLKGDRGVFVDEAME